MSKQKLIELRKQLRNTQIGLFNIIELLDDLIDSSKDSIELLEENKTSKDTFVGSSLSRNDIQTAALDHRQGLKRELEKIKEEPLLKKIPELTDEKWPEAIFEKSIPRNDEQEETRADLAIARLPIRLKGKILDFGCGEGFITNALKNKGYEVLGYDISSSKRWGTKSFFTNNWEDVLVHSQKQLYDIIVLYDVIDHLMKESLDKVLIKLKSVLSDGGKIIIMAHPWTARHGGHCYKELNLAYVHLVLKPNELHTRCPGRIPTDTTTLKPMAYYNKMFTEHFVISSKSIIPTIPEPWVVDNLLPHINKNWYSNKMTQKQLIKILSISGIFYTLEHQPVQSDG